MSRPRSFDHGAVVDAAMQAFWAGGLVATSVDDLVQASGLARSSLYGSFGNRDGVVRAAVERYVDVQIAAITRLFTRHGFADALRRLLVDAAVDNFDGRGCLLVNAVNELHASDAAGAEAVRAAFARLAAALQRTLAEAAPQRDDNAQLAAMLMAAIAGLRTLQRGGTPLALRRAAAARFAAALLQP
ncbi:HTH-type transcriptional repressor ComR [mine drainage metagenome]|jgi:TetR/AcrR family transcriptional repressor of nem operon|uniref:HTH-type transcriptional repressor ComR n=1 Tax=mine drainage metagenome TaxID=410659 RepID=A0A1J5PXP0_9ZZZZ